MSKRTSTEAGISLYDDEVALCKRSHSSSDEPASVGTTAQHLAPTNNFDSNNSMCF